MKFERKIEFTPAYDKRHSDPNKNYGIGCVQMKWILQGSHGAVQFLLLTGWFLPHVMEEHKNHGISKPMAADLSYHSPKPMYKGQSAMPSKCEYVEGGKCYFDGSTLAADKVFDVLVEKGGEACWKELENYYHAVFLTKEL